MPGNNAISEDQLLHLIAMGDEKAFSRFYQLTSSQLYNAIMIFVKDQAVACEIMQVCYIRIWNRRQGLQHIKSLKDYLFILARNAAFDHFKKVTIQLKLITQIQSEDIESYYNAEHAMEEKEFDRLYHQVISYLPKQQRQVYLLAVEEQLSYEEIAEQMHVSRFTVKRHLEIARRFVRKYMRNYLQEELTLLLLLLFSTYYMP